MLCGITGVGGSATEVLVVYVLYYQPYTVRRVPQYATIQGPEQARQYTQYTRYGVDILNGQSNNFQGILSILGFFARTRKWLTNC